MRLAVLSLLVIASCAPRGTSGVTHTKVEDQGVVSGDLRILTMPDPASTDPIEGGLGLFYVAVRNVSKQYVILRDLALPDGTPLLTWVNPPPKPLDYDAAADEYRSQTGPRSAGEAVHIGFLMPGESIIFRPQVRLLNLPRRYLLSYLSYTPEQVSQNVYFESSSGGVLRYTRKAASDVAAIPTVNEAAATHRSVVFPYAHSPTESPSVAELVLDVETPPRRFRLADALRRAAVAPADVEESTYCIYLEGWAFRTRSKSWLVTPRTVTPLPRITRFELCFFHLDTIESHLPAQFEFTGSLDVRFPDRRIVPLRDAQERTRKLAFIAREDVAGFLKEVADKGLEVEVRAEGRALSMLLRSAAHASTPTIEFAAALKRAGILSSEVIEHVWSDAIGAWAIRTKARSWYVSERAAGALPSISWLVWFFGALDERAGAGDVKFIIPAGEEDMFPWAPGGIVRRGDLARFLTAVHERKMSIDVDPQKDAPFRLKR